MVEREPAACRPAVDAAPAVTREECPAGDLSLDGAGHAHVGDQPDHVWPRIRVRGRMKRLFQLVHRTVQVVYAPLERDREIDEILLPASEQDELGGPDGLQLPPGESGNEQGDNCPHAGSDRDPLRGREAHQCRGTNYATEKMTLYSAELFPVLVSPVTGSTSTLTVVGRPKRPVRSMLVNVTVCVSPASMTGIFFFLTIDRGDFWIVSVTVTLNS